MHSYFVLAAVLAASLLPAALVSEAATKAVLNGNDGDVLSRQGRQVLGYKHVGLANWEKASVTITSNATSAARRLSAQQPDDEPVLAKDAGAIKIFIGVFQATSEEPPVGRGPRRNSTWAQRRAAVRSTWYNQAARYPHVLVRFIVDEPSSDAARQELLQEQQQHADVMVWAPASPALAANSSRRADKLRSSLSEVLREYPAVEWVIRMDDTVYVLPQRLLMALDQLATAKADYAGCMTSHSVPASDPNALLLAARYPLHARREFVVLSARAVQLGVVLGYDLLRVEGPEDVALGLWMLATEVNHFPDPRFCQMPSPSPNVTCTPTAVAMYSHTQRGMPLEQMAKIAADPNCNAPPTWPLPYLAVPDPTVEEWTGPLRI